MWKVFLFLIVLLLVCLNRPLKEYLFEGYGHVNYEENSNYIKDHDTIKNIYGEKLKQCRYKHEQGNSGSWSKDGFCDEMDGGVHQICVEVDKTDNFSENTGQGPWSEDRQGKNHCMCLGAWALYKARQDKGHIITTKDELRCESIPETALNKRYINKWATWNGNELPNQIINGINAIYEQCGTEATVEQKAYLDNLYDTIKKTYMINFV
jgi:hypothetical protein